MHEPEFWTDCAKAMELSIEGQRLIANEVADLVRDFWRRATEGVKATLRGHSQRRQVPPV